jgi:hypothetical protein
MGITAGIIIGSLVVGLASLAVQIIAAQGSINSSAEGPRLGDQSISVSTYGADLNIVYGQSRLACNMIWTTGVEEVRIVTVKKSGGGLFSKRVRTTTITYEYYGTFAMGVCEGYVDSPVKIFLDGKLALDGTEKGAYNKPEHSFTLFPGSEDQNPSAVIAEDKGADTPAFRGLCYVVVDRIPLADYGNRIPNFSIIVISTTPYTLGGTAFQPLSNDFTAIDVNTNGTFTQWVVDPTGGFAYGFSQVFGQTYITKIDYIASTVVYSKELLYNGSSVDTRGSGSRDFVVDLSGNIYATFIDGGLRGVAKINPGSGEVIDRAEYAGTGSFGPLNISQLDTVFGPKQIFFFWDYGVNELKIGETKDMGLFSTARSLNVTGLIIDDIISEGTEGLIWVLAHKTSDGRPLLIRVSTSSVYAAANPGDPPTEDIQTSEDLFDLSGTGTPLAGYIEANPIEEFRGGAGQTPMISYVEADGTFIIGFLVSDVAGSDFQIAKFDLGTEEIVVVRDQESYEDVTSTDQFTFPVVTGGMVVPPPNKPWTWTSYHAENADGLTEPYVTLSTPDTGLFAYTIDPVTLQFTQRYQQDISEFTPYFDATSGWVQLPNRLSLIGDATVGGGPNPAYVEIFLRRFAGSLDLEVITRDIVLRSGCAKHYQIDASDLAGIDVPGYVVGSRTDVRSNLVPLMIAFDYNVVESDWKLKFLRYGKASSRTLLARDLGVGANRSQDEALQIKQAQDLDQSMQIDIRHLDPARDEQENVASYKRTIVPYSTVGSQSLTTLDVPVSLAQLDAATVAKRTLARMWTERNTGETRLPPKYLGIDPLDVITVTVDGFTRNMRVSEASIGADRSLDCKVAVEDSGASSLVGVDPNVDFTDPTIPEVGEADVVAMDTSLLSDFDDAGDEYVVYAGFEYQRAGFPGADALIGDTSASLEFWFSNVEDLMVGFAQTELGYTGIGVGGAFGSTQVIDDTNTVDVFVDSRWTFPTTAASELDFLAGTEGTGGAKLWFESGELVQAKTITDNGGGSYTLSDLLRGRRGTEWAITEHFQGEKIVVLTEVAAGLADTNFIGAEIGTGPPVSKIYQVRTVGSGNSNPVFRAVTFNANSLRPFSPANVAGERDGSNNLIVNWIRRSRVQHEQGWPDGEDFFDQALNEVNELYEVDLLQNSGYDPTDITTWSVVATRDNLGDALVFAVSGDFALTDNGDYTATITDNGSAVDFSSFQVGSYARTQGFDTSGHNTMAKVLASDATSVKLAIPNAVTDASNTGASVTQIGTFAVFTAAEVASAGYSTTEPVHIAAYQISGVVGRGRPGFDSIGVDR